MVNTMHTGSDHICIYTPDNKRDRHTCYHSCNSASLPPVTAFALHAALPLVVMKRIVNIVTVINIRFLSLCLAEICICRTTVVNECTFYRHHPATDARIVVETIASMCNSNISHAFSAYNSHTPPLQ